MRGTVPTRLPERRCRHQLAITASRKNETLWRNQVRCLKGWHKGQWRRLEGCRDWEGHPSSSTLARLEFFPACPDARTSERGVLHGRAPQLRRLSQGWSLPQCLRNRRSTRPRNRERLLGRGKPDWIWAPRRGLQKGKHQGLSLWQQGSGSRRIDADSRRGSRRSRVAVRLPQTRCLASLSVGESDNARTRGQLVGLASRTSPTNRTLATH